MEPEQGTSDVYQMVLRRCEALLGPTGDAEDAAQEVFVRAAAAGRDEEAVEWLLAVAGNVCVDVHRRHQRGWRAMVRMGGETTVAGPEPTVVGEVLLNQILPRLSPAEARLLVHRLRTGDSLKETAAVLGVAASTARNLAMRTRRKLAYLLPQLGPVPAALARARRFCRRALREVSKEPALVPAVSAVIAVLVSAGLAGGPPALPPGHLAVAHPRIQIVAAGVPRPGLSAPVALVWPPARQRPEGRRPPGSPGGGGTGPATVGRLCEIVDQCPVRPGSGPGILPGPSLTYPCDSPTVQCSLTPQARDTWDRITATVGDSQVRLGQELGLAGG